MPHCVALQLLEAFAGNIELKSGDREAGETLVRHRVLRRLFKACVVSEHPFSRRLRMWVLVSSFVSSIVVSRYELMLE